MKLALIIFVLFFNAYLHAQNITYLSGNISRDTRWSGQIYIDGDIVVQRGVTLSIDSGSRIIFKANQDKLKSGNSVDRVEFIVLGKLLAKGKPRNAKIIFTSDASEQRINDWYGIVIKNLNDVSILQHCIIEYGYKGITCYGSSPLIEDCEIRFNYIAGVSCEVRSSPIIRNSTIFGNDFAGINCELASLPIIEKCSIMQNTNGVMIFDRSQPDLGHSVRGDGLSMGQNRILNNDEYNIYNHSTNDIYAQSNIWNMPTERQINQTLYDNKDNSAYGKIVVLPASGGQQPRTQVLSQVQQPSGGGGYTPETQSINLPDRTDRNPTSTNPQRESGNGVQQPGSDSGLVAGGSTNGTNGYTDDNPEIDEPPVFVPAAPETVFVVKEVNRDKPPKEQNKINLDEPIIEGLLDSGRREYIRKATPIYPEIYRMTGHEGNVIMEVIVGKNGRVEDFKIIRSDGENFSEAATEALKKYIYKPGTFKNIPVRFKIIERFKFKLEN
jgi:TonB family protein